MNTHPPILKVSKIKYQVLFTSCSAISCCRALAIDSAPAAAAAAAAADADADADACRPSPSSGFADDITSGDVSLISLDWPAPGIYIRIVGGGRRGKGAVCGDIRRDSMIDPGSCFGVNK